MKKRIFGFVASSIVLLSLTACGVGGGKQNVSSDNSEPGEIKGEIVFATNQTNIVDTKLKELADAYMKENEGTTIKIEGLKDYDSTMQTRIAGGQAPDIFYRIDSISNETAKDYFLPLDDLGFTEKDITTYENAASPDGNVYTIADSIDYTGIVYNKQAFKNAGVTEVPQTISDLMAASAKLKEAGITPMGTAYKDKWPIYPWIDFDVVATVMTGDPLNGKASIAEENNVINDNEKKTADILRDMNLNGYLESDVMSANWDQLKLDLAQAKMAMVYLPSWFPTQLVELGAAESDIGMFPFPEAKGILVSTNKVWGVSKDSKAPALAKDFLRYLIEDGRYAKACLATPSWKEDAGSQGFMEELLSFDVPVVEPGKQDPRVDQFTALQNESEVDEQTFLQNYIIEKDDAKAQKIIDDVNEKWAKAQEKLK
ncbi:ABC transporter substrate-binding protein [Enterococcus sp.]|uniref:ABC transporter substrate-binding protein n=1 Tax=Enterococcus sp. TaxID=35783 RepID=UPI003C73D33B